MPDSRVLQVLRQGTVIPAHPLALNARRRLDERRQRALTRYYLTAGAGGLAVGVHTTQFAIHDPRIGLLEPVLELAAEQAHNHEQKTGQAVVKIAGICGMTEQAVREADLARNLGYDIGLLSLSAFATEPMTALIDHARAVSATIPIMGFYLQPAVGGRVLPISFWREFATIKNLVAIKMAPFNRYQTNDVIRAIIEAGRFKNIALYTGNDDHILLDLLTPHCFMHQGRLVTVRIVGGLLGHWAVWTRQAVEQLNAIQTLLSKTPPLISTDWLTRSIEVTDSNAAFFDAANCFAGGIAGMHEVLRRQGLLEGRWCLDPHEDLSPGQMEDIDRVYSAYPHLNDDAFVKSHLDEWLA